MVLCDVLMETCFCCCRFLLICGGMGGGVLCGAPSGLGFKNPSSQSSGNSSRSMTCFLGSDVVVAVDVGVDAGAGGINSRVSQNKPTFMHNCCARCKK